MFNTQCSRPQLNQYIYLFGDATEGQLQTFINFNYFLGDSTERVTVKKQNENY